MTSRPAITTPSLLMPQLAATTLVNTLRAPTVHYQAKDLLRASRLPLKKTNAHVAGDLAATKWRAARQCYSFGEISARLAPTIADGYHRVCASYWVDENAEIPCRVVDLATGASPSESPAES